MLRTKFAVLDVGHGNSAVLTDTERIVVIDTGIGNTLQQYLREEGAEIIDLILLSHADSDHIGGLIHLLASQEFQIERVFLNTDSIKDTDLWDDLIYELNRAHNAEELVFETSLVEGDSSKFDQDEIQLEILGPSRYLAGKGPGSKDRNERLITTNSISAVVRLSVNGKPVALVPGDIDDVGLEDLIASGIDASAPVLVFPHHGGRPGRGDAEAFAKRVCELVSPTTAIFSIGRGQHGTPRPDIVFEIRKTVPDIRIACTQLSEHCAAALPGFDPDHLNPEAARGRELHKCCAGTITIYLDDPDAILPPSDLHLEFIRTSAPTALCTSDLD